MSVIPLDNGGWRALFNRDEQRARLPARRPEQRMCGDQLGLFPVDPSSNGTWIGKNNAGLAIALLNRNVHTASNWQRTKAPSPTVSRGTIIPHLLAGTSREQAEHHLQELPIERMPHFQLIILHAAHYVYWEWDGDEFAQKDCSPIQKPIHWSSSGLGDDLVRGPRAQRFNDIFRENPECLTAAQDAFHRDRTGQNSATWVNMTREDARTVSHTELFMDYTGQCSLTYAVVDESGQIHEMSHELAP